MDLKLTRGTDPPPTGSTIVPAPRKKLDSEFNDEENKLEMADTQAEIILSLRFPRTHLLHYSIRQATIGDLEQFYDSFNALRAHARKVLKKTVSSLQSIVDQTGYVAHTTYAPYVDEGPNVAVAFMANLSSTRDAPGRTFDFDAETKIDAIRSVIIICIFLTPKAQTVPTEEKEKIIAFLQSEKEKILSRERIKDLADSYLGMK
ncbi:hypothetical protein Tco_0086690 [Tanacetum coccineum]